MDTVICPECRHSRGVAWCDCCKTDIAELNALRAERDAGRAEVKRLQDSWVMLDSEWRNKYDALRAELAQERNERDATADMLRELRADYDALRAENAQLRQLKAGTIRVELANSLLGSDKYVPEQAFDALRAENEKLLAENEQWRKLPGVGVEASLLARVQKLRAELSDAKAAASGFRMQRDQAEAENERLRAALRRITEQGRVCAEFELCTHIACQSSYEAWSVADAALKGETPESANERALREFTRHKRA